MRRPEPRCLPLYIVRSVARAMTDWVHHILTTWHRVLHLVSLSPYPYANLMYSNSFTQILEHYILVYINEIVTHLRQLLWQLNSFNAVHISIQAIVW